MPYGMNLTCRACWYCNLLLAAKLLGDEITGINKDTVNDLDGFFK